MWKRQTIYQDKVTVVTGAASGIGRALVEELCHRGAIVVASDCDVPELNEVVDALARTGSRVSALPLNVTDLQAFKAAIEEVLARYGRIDYLFNNAGVAVTGEAKDFSISDWKTVLDVNLMGVIHGVFAVYPVMVQQRFGHIVNVASVAGLVPIPCQISYVASKFGVVGLSYALRIEGADLGVKVTVVCPGKIETPLYQTSKVIGFDRERLLSLVPKGITPKQCATIILSEVARNKSIVVVTGAAKLLGFVMRLHPDLALTLARGFTRRMRRCKAASQEWENEAHGT